jgi:hypothetical protein
MHLIFRYISEIMGSSTFSKHDLEMIEISWSFVKDKELLVDNDKYLDEYDALVIEMQKMIMEFNINFIKNNILSDLDVQIDKIKIAISALKTQNKAIKYIQNIHKENNAKLKESLDSKYFKALRYRGIPFKKIIEDKKQIAELKEKIQSKNKKSNSNQKNNTIDLNDSSSNSSISDDSVSLKEHSSKLSNNSNYLIHKHNVRSILKKDDNNSFRNNRSNNKYDNDNFNRKNQFHRRTPNRSRSFNRSRSNVRKRSYSRNRSNSRNFSNRYNHSSKHYNNNNNNKSSFKPNSSRNFSNYNKDQIQNDFYDENLFNVRKDFKRRSYENDQFSNSNNKSINFRLPASHRINS